MRHPAFYTLARLAARTELRKKGYRFAEINDIIASVTDDVIDVAEMQAVDAQNKVVDLPVGAIGDGAIIKAIKDFLASDLGKVLIQFLLSLLGV